MDFTSQRRFSLGTDTSRSVDKGVQEQCGSVERGLSVPFPSVGIHSAGHQSAARAVDAEFEFLFGRRRVSAYCDLGSRPGPANQWRGSIHIREYEQICRGCGIPVQYRQHRRFLSAQGSRVVLRLLRRRRKFHSDELALLSGTRQQLGGDGTVRCGLRVPENVRVHERRTRDLYEPIRHQNEQDGIRRPLSHVPVGRDKLLRIAERSRGYAGKWIVFGRRSVSL